MFTGIIEEIGRISAVTAETGGVRLTVEAPSAAAELGTGDSVAVNGVCLTVVAKAGRMFTAQAVEETLAKTTLAELSTSAEVNLELPVRLNERLGGHLVLGHVDCVGTVSAVEMKEGSRIIRVAYPAEFARYVIPVGSVALDGISLTVASIAGNEFAVSVIPHTLEKTTLSRAARGTRVNLEFDVIGKYVERLTGSPAPSAEPASPVTAEKLRSWGYRT